MTYKLFDNGIGSICILEDYPLECPKCHQKTTPNYHSNRIAHNSKLLYATLSCPNPKCEKGYIAEYYNNHENKFTFKFIVKGSPKTAFYSEEIQKLSPMFIKIYNEAFTAEQMNLNEICGVGYRKALEYLIKDFLIFQKPQEDDKIKKMFLGKCIKDLVDDPKIKRTAKRAVWLGNDHTHYVKKWENKDLTDLKKLIRLTIHWVESEIITLEFEESMPE